ncbi:MAG: YjjG family noncanonical pyrimidine nucleotidase [Bacteroidota bacterium]
MPYQYLLFDADNTLFDFSEASHLAFAQLLRAEGHDYHETHYATYQAGNELVWREFERGLIDARELRVKRFRLFFERSGLGGDPAVYHQQYMDNLIRATELLSGTLPLLEKLYGRVRMAIITNGLREAQRPRIRKLGLDRYFDHIIVSDEIGSAKPDPAFFDYTFAQLQQPDPECVLVIGDSLSSDIQGGLNYGLDTCWFNPQGKPNEGPVRPRYEVRSIERVWDIVRGAEEEG